MSENLRELLQAATISAIGLDVTIACHDYATRNAILDALDSLPDGRPMTPAEMLAMEKATRELDAEANIILASRS